MITQGNESTTSIWLLQRACSGDREACSALVTQHRARAVRVARSFVRDKDLAEDIAQEAFVRTFQKITGLRNPQAFFSYLMRTIVRLCIDHSRKLSSYETPIDFDDQLSDFGQPNEEAIYVRSVLSQLSIKQRAVIILRDVDGMDYESIARTLRLPIGTVRSRLAAARASFKELYLDGIEAEKEGAK